MSEYAHIGDYDIFVCGRWLTTFYHITFGEALDLVEDFPFDAEDIDVILRV